MLYIVSLYGQHITLLITVYIVHRIHTMLCTGIRKTSKSICLCCKKQQEICDKHVCQGNVIGI